MNGLPMLPAIIIDVAGSTANIVFAFLATRYAYKLTRLKPGNFLWGYLFYVTLAISAFAVSRAVGHITREVLYSAGEGDVWAHIAPLSGGFNTLFMIAVAAVMLFYQKGVQSYEAIEEEAARLKQSELRLEATARELKELNFGLEDMVEKRAVELSESEKRFRHLFSASKDIVFFSGASHELVEMNPAGCEVLQLEPEAIPAMYLKDIFCDQTELAVFNTHLAQQGFLHDYEAKFRKKDETVISVLISATALHDDKGRFAGAESIAKDLTRLKSMMEQLVASEKMASVGQMAAGIAHEINTPLGVILGYAQLMMDDFSEDSDTYQSLLVIERQTRASRKIVADLLKYSRHSSSLRQPVDLNEIVEDVAAITGHSLGLNHVQLHKSLGRELPQIMGDPEKLRQVVVNLVNNASQAMEEQGGGVLMLRTLMQADGAMVCIEVQNSGHGIAPHIKARIFDPFFTTKPVGKGTGLGLSVTYGIVQEHGGTITLESPVREKLVTAGYPSGNGTLFRLAFPVSADLEESAKPAPDFDTGAH